MLKLYTLSIKIKSKMRFQNNGHNFFKIFSMKCNKMTQIIFIYNAKVQQQKSTSIFSNMNTLVILKL